MKVNVALLLQMRKEKAWSQDELATASGLNLRTIQRIENEATASLQSMKALASVFDVTPRDLEQQDADMINELVGHEVGITTTYIGALHTVKGEIVEIQAPWVKVRRQKERKLVYINLNQIIQITPL